jgi:hypothetical protein
MLLHQPGSKIVAVSKAGSQLIPIGANVVYRLYRSPGEHLHALLLHQPVSRRNTQLFISLMRCCYKLAPALRCAGCKKKEGSIHI